MRAEINTSSFETSNNTAAETKQVIQVDFFLSPSCLADEQRSRIPNNETNVFEHVLAEESNYQPYESIGMFKDRYLKHRYSQTYKQINIYQQIPNHLKDNCPSESMNAYQDSISDSTPRQPIFYIPTRNEKNIFSYQITPSLQAFYDPQFRQKAIQISTRRGANYEDICYFCKSLKKETNSIASFSSKLFGVKDKKEQKERYALLDFIELFLKNFYLRIIINQGRMQDPEAYIRIKNGYVQVQIHLFRKQLEAMQFNE